MDIDNVVNKNFDGTKTNFPQTSDDNTLDKLSGFYDDTRILGLEMGLKDVAKDSEMNFTIRGWADSYHNTPAGYHNSIYRGKLIGSTISDIQWISIATGLFVDMWIGDYWIINGTNWRIAGFDYWYSIGYPTVFNKHHVVLVPDTRLDSGSMNSTDTTEGGYMASEFYTSKLATINGVVESAFGASHVPSHRVKLPDSCTSGKYVSDAWADAQCMLMNEQMVYGHRVQSAADNKRFDMGTQYMQLPLFAFNKYFVKSGGDTWLQNVASATQFCFIDGGTGIVQEIGASYNTIGYRPVFAIVGN